MQVTPYPDTRSRNKVDADHPRPKPGRVETLGGMSHLEAVIGAEPVLRDLGPAVELSQHLWLVPMTDELFDALTVDGAAKLDGFWKAPLGFGARMQTCSTHGAVAYVEADYTGGVGTQAAQVWDAGSVALGPLRLAVGDPIPPEGSPISRALRQLGVDRGEHADEFEAVGLNRPHPNTANWVP